MEVILNQTKSSHWHGRPVGSSSRHGDGDRLLPTGAFPQPKPSAGERELYVQSLVEGRKELRALGSIDGMLAHGRLRTVTSALLECSTTWEHKFTLEQSTEIKQAGRALGLTVNHLGTPFIVTHTASARSHRGTGQRTRLQRSSHRLGRALPVRWKLLLL